MRPEFEVVVRNFLADGGSAGGGETRGVAERATQACERLSHELSKLVGQQGVNTLFKRSAFLVKQQSPWLAYPNPWESERRDNPWLWLRTSMEPRDSQTATEAFVLVLSVVIDLLENLVGEAQVRQLLQDAWPAVFLRDLAATREQTS